MHIPEDMQYLIIETATYINPSSEVEYDEKSKRSGYLHEIDC